MRSYIPKNKGGIIFLGVVALIIGFIFIFFSIGDKRQITRDEALVYEGTFEKFEIVGNKKYDYVVYFTNGEMYAFNAFSAESETVEKLQALPRGAQMKLLVSPHSGCILEATADGRALNDFYEMQKSISSYSNGYIAIGVFMILASPVCLYAAFNMNRLKCRRKRPQKR